MNKLVVVLVMLVLLAGCSSSSDEVQYTRWGVLDNQVGTFGTEGYWISIQPSPGFGGLFLNISWQDSQGRSGSQKELITGQGVEAPVGPGGDVPPIWVRCYPLSCKIGEVVVYLPEGWRAK